MSLRMSAMALILLLVPPRSSAVSLTLPKAKPAAAQAEVSAAKPPVKLTLSVYRTTLKLQNDFKLEMDYERLDKEHPPKDEHSQDGVDLEQYERQVPVKVGEPLWIKINLKNIGTKTMNVLDPLFTGRMDFRHAIADNSYGVKVRITGPDGKDLPQPNPKNMPSGACYEAPWSKVNPAGTARIAAWRKAGKTDQEINDLLNKELQDEQEKKKEWDKGRRPIVNLQPGESTTTRPWHKIRCNDREYGVFPSQVGDFAELWDYHLDSPGTYKIRAVYYDDPYSSHKKGADLRFETPAVSITVVRGNQ